MTVCSKILSEKGVPAAFEDLNRIQLTSATFWRRFTTPERVYSGTDTLSSERPDSVNRSPTGNELDSMSPVRFPVRSFTLQFLRNFNHALS